MKFLELYEIYYLHFNLKVMIDDLNKKEENKQIFRNIIKKDHMEMRDILNNILKKSKSKRIILL